MIRKHWIVVVPVIGIMVAAAGWAVRAQEPQTTTEKLKAKAGAAVQSVKKGFSSAGEAIKDRYERTVSSVKAMNIEARVYARLHWEKALVGSKVELSAPSEGEITLHGTVTDAKAKAKAVELANDTLGVTKVNDSLVIGSAAATPTK
jgi:osmotically-inducible protein OsmY